MLFNETKLKGAYVIDIEPHPDNRGFFARTFCMDEFVAKSLDNRIVQCNISYNKKKGTIRGMHYQVAPHEESKLVSCARGCIFDVIIDLRADSATYGQWTAVELCGKNSKMLYIPKGFAHGFQTLRDEVVVCYQMMAFYYPDASRGVRWNDPAFGIEWPLEPFVISERDRQYPDFNL